MIPTQAEKRRNLYSTPEPIKFQLITFISKQKKNLNFKRERKQTGISFQQKRSHKCSLIKSNANHPHKMLTKEIEGFTC